MLKVWLSKLMNPFMQVMHITCKDTSPVISEMLDHPVSSAKYWRARIHLAMCGVCRYYKTQLEILTQVTHELASEDSPAKMDVSLSPESKAHLKNVLKSQQ
jgi:hypothetical protein